MRRAWSARARAEVSWSMRPQGTRAKSCSARWQARAAAWGFQGELVRAKRARARATSREAELERPPPSGTSEAMVALKAGRGEARRGRRWKRTPST